jgi:tetratricopeptide (TPR) repeat protein
MGRVGAAMSDDATALFWNPARLSAVARPELQLFRTQLFADGIGYHAGFFAYPTLEQGTFAVGYQRLGVESIERRDSGNFLLGDFESSESLLLLGAGLSLSRGFSLGVAARLVQQEIDEASATGFGADLGLGYEHPLDASRAHRLGLGLNLQNLVEPRLRLDAEDVPDPRNVKLGVAYSGAPTSSRLSWALAADVDLPREGERRWGVGAELALDRLLMLRVGQDAGRLTAGVALGARGFTVEYAMLDGGDLSRNDRFSVRWTFGSSTDERRDRRLQAREADVQRQLGALLESREHAALEDALRRGDAAFDAHRWDAARDAYRSVLLVEPEHPHALARVDACEKEMMLATADEAQEAGDLAAAANDYRKVLERWPDSSRAQSGLRAVRTAMQASQNRKAQIDGLFRHALGLFADGDLIGTHNSLEELLRLDPHHALGLELRERSEALRLQRGDAALQSVHRSADAGRFDDAFRSLAEARHLLPERAEECDALRAQLEQRRDEAARQARLAATPEPTAPAPTTHRPRPISAAERAELRAMFQAGLREFEAGRFDRAISQWQSIWDRRPGFEEVGDYLVKANLLQGVQLYSQGEYAAAMRRCERVLDIDPGNAKAQRYLARIREEQQELQQLRGR